MLRCEMNYNYVTVFPGVPQEGSQPFSDRVQEEWLDDRAGGRGVRAGADVASPRQLAALQVPRHQPGATGAAAAHREGPAPAAGR